MNVGMHQPWCPWEVTGQLWGAGSHLLVVSVAKLAIRLPDTWASGGFSCPRLPPVMLQKFNRRRRSGITDASYCSQAFCVRSGHLRMSCPCRQCFYPVSHLPDNIFLFLGIVAIHGGTGHHRCRSIFIKCVLFPLDFVYFIGQCFPGDSVGSKVKRKYSFPQATLWKSCKQTNYSITCQA